MTSTLLPVLASQRILGLSGTIEAADGLPGDKSISHRSLIFASLAEGITEIFGLNNGKDVDHTRSALESLGVSIQSTKKSILVQGMGMKRAWKQPVNPVYLGNSGTSVRLLCGLVATKNIKVTFYGDSSLSQRPMQRVIAPLKKMGASFETAVESSLPLTIKGTTNLSELTYTMPIASAQVKTALIIAGMSSNGTTKIVEPIITRDHTERMLQYLNYPIEIETAQNRSQIIRICGRQPLNAKDIFIPVDTSAAAFLTVAALITPKSHLKIEGVCWNPFRHVVFRVLETMGAKISISNVRVVCGEPVADIEVFSSTLSPVEIDTESSTPLIDEYPVLAIAAATVCGVSEFHGLSELRYKESNRLQAIADGLNACGIKAVIQGDSLKIEGNPSIFGGATIHANKDHRIAMAFYILGMVSQNPILINGADTINTSFPDFLEILNRLNIKS